MSRLCVLAGVHYSSVWRVRRGHGRRLYPGTLARLRRALAGKPAQVRTPPPPVMIRTVYRGFMLAIAQEFFPGLPADAAAIEALAQDPALSANPNVKWAAAAKARSLAVYCTVIELNLPGAQVARAVGVTRQAVSVMLRRVEDLRDDPAIEALIGRAGEILIGKTGDDNGSDMR